MQYSLAAVVLAGLAAANPYPQAVTSSIAPSASASSDCSSSYDGTFEIQVVNVTTSSKRSFQKRQSSALVLSLEDGTLKDAKGRTGYIAANNQFQFDGPPQAGALVTTGWAVCSNGTLALGPEAVFYQCLSGTFYNLYDESTGAQCSPVYIQAIGGSGSASQAVDGQVTATPVESQQSDGQPTGSPVAQITDGQIQASTAAAPVSQISDGQIQVTSAAAAPVSQISDGQIQVTSAAAAPVSQISDGQIQAPTNGSVASATATVQPYTGAAAIPTMRSELFGLAAGVLAIAML